MAIRHKKDSSLVKALNMVKNKEADASYQQEVLVLY